MSSLLVRPHAPDVDGRVLAVTPESAGWSYVGFELFRLEPGRTLDWKGLTKHATGEELNPKAFAKDFRG